MKSPIKAAVLSAALVLGGAATASAATTSTGSLQPIIGVPNGTAGVPLTITVIAPKLAGQTIGLSASLDNALTPVDDVTLDARGRGYVSWTPPYAGKWTVASSNGNTAVAPGSAVIAPMPTTTDLIVPNRWTRFDPLTLVATVNTGETPRVLGEAAVEDSLKVEGTVTFYEVYRGKLGSAKVTGLPGEAAATFSWWPPQYGDYAFYAVFEPSTTPAGGPIATSGSRSPIPHLVVSEHRTLVAMRMPEFVYVDQPTLVTAVLPEAFDRYVSFTVDDRPISPDRPAVDGKAEAEWTPLEPGVHTVSIELKDDRFPRIERRIDQLINVLPQPVPNPISVSPVIKGVAQKPWVDGQVLAWQGGQRIPLVMSTGSGAPVNLSQKGGCLITGSTVVTPPTGGGCVVTFSTVGDGGFGPNTATVIISSDVDPEEGKLGAKGDGRVQSAVTSAATSSGS